MPERGATIAVAPFLQYVVVVQLGQHSEVNVFGPYSKIEADAKAWSMIEGYTYSFEDVKVQELKGGK